MNSQAITPLIHRQCYRYDLTTPTTHSQPFGSLAMALKQASSRIGTLKARVNPTPNRRSTPNRSKLYGRKWRKYRAGFLLENPYCVFCRKDGTRTQATVCDHIEPHKGDETKFWDPNNHQPLCKRHHDSTKQQMERFAEGRSLI